MQLSSPAVRYSLYVLGRLISERIDEPGTSNDQEITYTYDAVGNRLEKTVVREGETIEVVYTYDDNDRLLTETGPEGTITYSYDANGNLVSRTDGTHTDTFTYDFENRLIEANIEIGPNPGRVIYTYDADGNRISKTVNGVTTTYLVDKNRDFAQVLVEKQNGEVVTYVYGLDLISMNRPGVGARYYLYDGQMSVRQLTDANGAVTNTYTYDAFGLLLESTGNTPNLYLYTGEQFDPHVGLYYLRARYYNPFLGRFTTMDSIPGNIFDPVSLHRYLYANADPVNNLDPSGSLTLPQVLTSIEVGSFLLGAYFTFTGNERLASAFFWISALAGIQGVLASVSGLKALIKGAVQQGGRRAVAEGGDEAFKLLIEKFLKESINAHKRIIIKLQEGKITGRVARKMLLDLAKSFARSVSSSDAEALAAKAYIKLLEKELTRVSPRVAQLYREMITIIREELKVVGIRV